MKKNFQLLLFICMLLATKGIAQQTYMDSVALMDHHPTALEVLQGDGDEHFVCYKQAHRNIYFIITGLIIVIAIVALKLLQLNKKTNRLLKIQNEIIEEKNKDIIDSITYAKRIQNSLLPNEKYIDKTLKRMQKS